MSFEVIFAQQKELQRIAIGNVEFFDTGSKVRYIRSMILELTDELHEILNEMDGWKLHDRSEPSINLKQARGEARDALQYLVNIFIALDMEPYQIYLAHAEKMKINIERARAHRDRKCPVCKSRSLDDPGSMDGCKREDCPK